MAFPFLILLSLFSQLSRSVWLREYKGWYLLSRNKCIFSISEDSFQLSRCTTFSELDGLVWMLPEWLSGRDFIWENTDEHCICYLSSCRDERASGMEFLRAPFEGMQFVIAWLGHEVAGHIVSAIRNQRTAKADVKLTRSSPSFSLGPQPMG